MRNNQQKQIRYLTLSAVIAAAYVTLSFVCESFGLLKYAIQLRIPEALCVLAAFTPAAVPGITVGCFLTNLLLGCAPPDIIFGTLATFIGAILGRLISKGRQITIPRLILTTFPTLIANTLIMPPVIVYSYGAEFGLPIVYLTVFIGEFLSATVIGTLVGAAVQRSKLRFD